MPRRTEHTRKPGRKQPWKRGQLCVPPPKGGGCGQRFRSVSTFDRHRRGRGDDRRCLTREEMRELGWAFSARRGGWTHDPMQKQLPFGRTA